MNIYVVTAYADHWVFPRIKGAFEDKEKAHSFATALRSSYGHADVTRTEILDEVPALKSVYAVSVNENGSIYDVVYNHPYFEGDEPKQGVVRYTDYVRSISYLGLDDAIANAFKALKEDV